MNTDPSTPGNDANLSALGREMLATGGSKPSGPWVPPTAEELGKLLPEYDIVKMLGRGGMGAVYMGRQISLDRPVAIKILSNTLDEADASFAERFKNEARAMGKLNHPGIVAVHDFGQTAGGLLYIVMEYVEGTDVARMIAKEGRLHTDHAMAITAHVCDALGYAHERGIIHRDIKPANIMVGYDGVVKVADFGLAKMTHSNASGLTQSGMAMGTLHYMAPEALMLGSAVDHRADIYAVGVMLYQMLTGKIPQGMFKLPSLQIPGLDPRYDAIITKAIMEDREARYQSVSEMRRDLDGILTQPVVKVEAEVSQAPAALPTMARPQRPGGQPYRPPQSAAQPVIQPKSSSSGLVWITLLVLALGAGAYWFYSQRNKSGQGRQIVDVTSADNAPSSTSGTAPATVTPEPSPTAPTVPAPAATKIAVVRKPWPTGPNFRSEGRFRAWSSVPNDPAMDLTKLQGIDDVKQVYVNSTGWLALRQNGDLLGNLSGIEALKDIRRICRGSADEFALITREGKPILFPPRTDATNRIPDGLGPVRDIYISGFRQAAILEDGSLVVWGTAHDGIDTRGNIEWKDKPFLPPGRKAVAMSNTVIAMVLRTDDGKILRWGNNSGFSRAQGRFNADNSTPFVMNSKALYAIAKPGGPILAANWGGNDLATPFPDDVRGCDFISTNRNILVLDDDGRIILDPMCEDRSITAALDFVTLAERDLVSAHHNAPAARFLWFDKASPVQTADAPPAPVSPVSPGIDLKQLPDFRTRIANYQKARHVQLSELTTKYRAALAAEKDAATKTGVLAAVTACDTAIANAAAFAQLIEANLTATEVKPLPTLAAVADPAPPRLQELCDIFVREVMKIESTLVAGLDQSLATVQATLVKADNLTAAKAVDTYRQQVSAAFKTPAASVGSMAAVSPPANLPNQTRIIQRVVAIQNVCAWPNLTLMPDGSVTAIVFNQPNHGITPGDLDCYASSDGLKWEKRGAVTAHEPDTIRMNHAAGLAGNGDLIVLCSGWTNMKQPSRPKQQPFRDAVLRSWVLRSKDGGRSWSKSDVFPATESTDWSDYVPFGDIWKAQDGSLRASCYQEHYVNPAQSIKGNGMRAWCFRSDDDGATWKPQALISPTHNETNLFPLGGKSWLAAARDAQVDLIRSDDDGATWGQPAPATGRGEVNGHLTRLADKRLLLSYGVRSRGSQGVCAKLSSDEGRTWSSSIRLADSLESDCGYPSCVQLANGRILTAYYSKRSSDYNGYHMGVTVWELAAASSASTIVPTANPAQAPLANIAAATKENPFVNSLGMKFVPVPGTKVLMCIHETRKGDYAAYAAAASGVNDEWRSPERLGERVSFADDHPVTSVNWTDAQEFCGWLSKKDQQIYRLPTDLEWSHAAGIGLEEQRMTTTTPEGLNGMVAAIFPWGGDYPPQSQDQAGNYSDSSRNTKFPKHPFISGYTDGFATTAPVMSFKPNHLGIYDLGGNLWEWVDGWWNSHNTNRVLRGAAWNSSLRSDLLTSGRISRKQDFRNFGHGFRIVLELP